jgi:hypothetical protein
MSKPIRLVPKSQAGCVVLLVVAVGKMALWAWGIHTAVSMGLLS